MFEACEAGECPVEDFVGGQRVAQVRGSGDWVRWVIDPFDEEYFAALGTLSIQGAEELVQVVGCGESGIA